MKTVPMISWKASCFVRFNTFFLNEMLNLIEVGGEVTLILK